MQHRQGRVDTATGEPPTAKCAALDGKCQCSAPGHPDHAGPITTIPAPHSAGALLDAQLMSFSKQDGAEDIALCLGWNAGGTELTPAEAHQLADELDQFAAKLRTLAAELQNLTDQA